MAKKPWRVVQPGEDTGRFTREQIEAAVLAVKERKEAAKRRKRGHSGPTSSPANGTTVAGSRKRIRDDR